MSADPPDILPAERDTDSREAASAPPAAPSSLSAPAQPDAEPAERGRQPGRGGHYGRGPGQAKRARRANGAPRPRPPPDYAGGRGNGQDGEAAERLSLVEMKAMDATALMECATRFGIENAHQLRSQDIIFKLLKMQVRKGEEITADGVLEILPDGFGFLRSRHGSYLTGSDDVYVSPNQVRRFGMRTGDAVVGKIRPPKEGERYFSLVRVEAINGGPSDGPRGILFENLTPLFPAEHLRLEIGNGATEDLSGRIIDMMAPIGKGQRGLIVSPPKAGKTLILQQIAKSVIRNNPECDVIVLLIDERPEEVTDMERSVREAEVVASTFDEPSMRHVQVADMVIERAKRLAENRRHVLILLDSITRLARAYNNVQPSSGKVLTGGVDAHALERPKRFFGAARNIEQGGSVTIIATALIDTGSKMDEVIYEEFKGTGNMELHLDRRIAEKRIYPAINIRRSGTRREEMLLDGDVLRRVWVLRRILTDMEDIQATESLIEKLKGCSTNDEFFSSLQ